MKRKSYDNCFFQVLLLEAGIEEPMIADVPSWESYLFGSSIDWGYTIERQNQACRSRTFGCAAYGGKVKILALLSSVLQMQYFNQVMGGSSTINGMFYVRGNQDDYNSWAQLGNIGWSYEEVLPYFKKSEGNYDLDVI